MQCSPSTSSGSHHPAATPTRLSDANNMSAVVSWCMMMWPQGRHPHGHPAHHARQWHQGGPQAGESCTRIGRCRHICLLPSHGLRVDDLHQLDSRAACLSKLGPSGWLHAVHAVHRFACACFLWWGSGRTAAGAPARRAAAAAPGGSQRRRARALPPPPPAPPGTQHPFLNRESWQL